MVIVSALARVLKIELDEPPYQLGCDPDGWLDGGMQAAPPAIIIRTSGV